jgi:hypothetical protein
MLRPYARPRRGAPKEGSVTAVILPNNTRGVNPSGRAATYFTA